MADSATQERSNTVKVADAGPSCKKLTIEVPADAVSEKLRDSMATLGVEAALPGFRKGRAPSWLVEKRFGPTVRKEAKNQLVAQAFQKAVEDLKLQVVGEPGGGNLAKVELVDGKPFVFEVEVEVLPEFDLPNIEGIELRKPTLEIADTMVEEEVQKLLINEGSLEPRETAEPGDYVTGHAVMTGSDGTEFYNLKGAVVQVPPADKGGKGMILGIIVDDFSKQLGTVKAGDERTIKAKGPENHEVEGIRNADLKVVFKAERVDRIIPAKVETLVNAFGVEDEKALRDIILGRMKQRVQIQQQGAMHQQVTKYLLEQVKMELPERMTSQQALRTLERRRLELMYRGVEADKIEEHMAELRAASSAAAARDLKLFFILHKVSENLGVRVTEGEMNGRIAAIAMQRNMRPDQLRQELVRTNQMTGIFQQIRDHKTLDVLVNKAKVSDISAEEYNKQVEAEERAEREKLKAKK